MDILIGTQNLYKVGELMYILEDLPNVVIHQYSEIGMKVEVLEDQVSLLKNAEKKAIEISKHTKYYVIASDGGVDIPGLGKNWDILRNQRIVGEDKTDIEKATKLIALMKGLEGEERRAEHHLAIAIALNGEMLFSLENITGKGYISSTLPDGNIPEYKWMGHVWIYPEYNKIFNSLNERELKEARYMSDIIRKSVKDFIESCGSK